MGFRMRTVNVSAAFLGRALTRDWTQLSEAGQFAILAWARETIVCEGSRAKWDDWVFQSVGVTLKFVRERLAFELSGCVRPMGGGRRQFVASVVCLSGCACGGGPSRWRSPPVVVEVSDEEG